MAKYYGKIGYERLVESTPGVWTPVTTVKTYYGDVYKQSRRMEDAQQLNDNVNISNTFSIVADPYAFTHIGEMKWIEWYGAKWKITDASIVYPRIELSIGGVYNAGDETTCSSCETV